MPQLESPWCHSKRSRVVERRRHVLHETQPSQGKFHSNVHPTVDGHVDTFLNLHSSCVYTIHTLCILGNTVSIVYYKGVHVHSLYLYIDYFTLYIINI